MKRFLSLALVLVMILSVMPMAMAATPGGNPSTPTGSANTGDSHKANNPDHDVKVTTYPATCCDYERKVYTCSTCNWSYTWVGMYYEESYKNNHSGPFKDATCVSAKICQGCGASIGEPDTTNHDWSDWEVETKATCVAKGEETRTCKNNCGVAPETREIPVDTTDAGHNWDAGVVKTPATCVAKGWTTYTCQNAGCPVGTKDVEDIAIDPDAHKWVDDKLECQNEGCTAKKELAVTASDIAINVGDTKQIKINVTGNVTSADVKVLGFTSADASIASVDGAGVVVGKKAGSTTVTVKVKVLDQEMTAVSNVTVYDGMITCADDMKSFGGNTAALTFKLTGVADDTDVKWTYSVSDKGTASELSDSTTVPSDTMTVTRKEYGTVTVKVKAEWRDNNTNKSTDATFTISFYETVDVEVTVKDGVSKFTFGETGAFSKVKVNDKIVTATYYKMMNLLTADDCDTVILTENKTSGNAKVGKITAPSGKTAYEPLKSNEYYTTDAYGMTFTVTGEGEYVLHYSVKDVTGPAKGLTLKTGTITIVTGEAEADIVYDVNIGGTVTLDETDFTAFWKKYGTGDLSYVEFDVSYAIPYAPEFGTLYTANDQKTLVLHTYDFVPNHTSTSKDYDLDTVTYVASEKMKTAYVDTLDFIAYNKNGVSVTGTIEFNVGTKNPFTDVKESDYFYEPVLWAVEEGVTTGISETEFGPNNPCTRGQVVTFLWRAAGKPEPKSSVNPFTDVKVSDYYYKAVLWAVEKGITTGMTATTFAPNSACTRGQVVTFLHRAANTPAATGTNSFTDVAAGAYYYNAVLWAVRNGITSGMSATSFAPNTSCTRGQIVTFLYRYYAD